MKITENQIRNIVKKAILEEQVLDKDSWENNIKNTFDHNQINDKIIVNFNDLVKWSASRPYNDFDETEPGALTDGGNRMPHDSDLVNAEVDDPESLLKFAKHIGMHTRTPVPSNMENEFNEPLIHTILVGTFGQFKKYLAARAELIDYTDDIDDILNTITVFSGNTRKSPVFRGKFVK